MTTSCGTPASSLSKARVKGVVGAVTAAVLKLMFWAVIVTVAADAEADGSTLADADADGPTDADGATDADADGATDADADADGAALADGAAEPLDDGAGVVDGAGA